MSSQPYLDNAEKVTGRTPQPLVASSHVIRKGPQFALRHTTGSHRDESGTLRLNGVDAA